MSNQLQQNSQESDSPNVYQTNANRATIIYDNSTEEDLADSDDSLEGLTGEAGDSATEEDLDALLDGLTGEEEAQPEVSEAFSNDFQKHFGVSVEDAKVLITELQEERAQRHIRDAHIELASHWQIPTSEVATRLNEVRKFWDKLPDDKKAKLDNPEGAKAMWAKLQAKTGTAALPLDRGNKAASGGSSKYEYTQAQIDRMPMDEYKRQLPQIERAYAQGRVRK